MNRWLVWSLVCFGVFVVYRGSQWRADDATLTWGAALEKAWVSLPDGPPEKNGSVSGGVSQFALNMLLVLPLLHVLRVVP